MALAMSVFAPPSPHRRWRAPVSFRGILTKLERKFEAKREEMERLVEESANANKQLDRTATALQRVEVATVREKQEFQSEWSKLGDTIKMEMQSEVNPRRAANKSTSPNTPKNSRAIRRSTVQKASKRRNAFGVVRVRSSPRPAVLGSQHARHSRRLR